MKFSKIFVAATVVFASSFAIAYPMVGDKVEYQGTVKKDPHPEQPINIKMEIKSFDAQKQEWIVQQDTTIGGQTYSETEDVDASDMFTPERVQYILTNCVARGGTLESVTVAAGAFDTCKMAKTTTEESKEIWIAAVPFGIVKMIEHDIEDGEHFSVELQSFTAAQ